MTQHASEGRTLHLEVIRRSALVRPTNREQLRAYVRHVLGFRMPRSAIVAGHTSPMEYLDHAFFGPADGPRDAVIWANRGGGKTQLGAIATLLDLIFKPGVQIRILGGSFEQSSKMHLYLKRLFEREPFASLLKKAPTERGLELVNGSRVEVLSQSEKSIRGQRVHILRCDEVELFDEGVWRAAQLVTRSGQCGEVFVPGVIEVFSTMHRPYGLMQRLVAESRSGARRLFRWNLLDVLERCPDSRPCDGCDLFDDCGGTAKAASGFFAIDDALAQQRRVGRPSWEAEMLCARPDVSDLVYPEFDRELHVFGDGSEADERLRCALPGEMRWCGGIDFGFRSPTAIIWAAVDGRDVIHLVDEHVASEWRAEAHVRAAREKPWPRPTWFAADPSGEAANDQTGISTARLWREAGFQLVTRRAGVNEGVRAVRERLLRADGTPGLKVHERCRRLIDAFGKYHYPRRNEANDDRDDGGAGDADRLQPVKDGHDHIMDALRYLVVNLNARLGAKVVCRSYL